MRARALILVVAAWLAPACGAEAPRPVVRPPPLVVKATPAPARARWVLPSSGRDLTGKLELGDGATLYVGRNGRRMLARGTKLEDASTLALDDLAGVLRDGAGGFVFIASDGDAWPAKDPLGELGAARPGPLGAEPRAGESVVSVAVGRAAALAVLGDGRLFRTSDFGSTWKPVHYAGASNEPFGGAASVALDSKGNGLLVHLPQRLFVTHDDGATWAPAASPNVGAVRAVRDGADHVLLVGYGGRLAKLDGQTLAATKDRAVAVYYPPLPTQPTGDGEPRALRTLLAGDRTVTLEAVSRGGATHDVLVRSAKLGEPPGEPVSASALVGSSFDVHVAARGPTVLFMREEDDDDSDAALFASRDFGATWSKSASLEGVDPRDEMGLDLAAGPNGWAYVASLCPRERTREDDCAPPRVRPAGAPAFQDIAPSEIAGVRRVAFDQAHDKVYVTGYADGQQHVYESPLGRDAFTRIAMLDAPVYASVELTVDPAGTLRVMEYDSDKRGWVLHRRTAGGKDLPTLYVPLETGELRFAGARGVLFVGHDRGYETADGGETWTRVATSGYAKDLECSDAGCLTNGAVRVGWDLPAMQGGQRVTASSEPPKTAAGKLPPPPPAQVRIDCKPVGAASSVGGIPSPDVLDDRTADLRWASVLGKPDGSSSILVGSRTRTRELGLLGPYPKLKPSDRREFRSAQRVQDDGVVVLRYGFVRRTGRGGLNPVDVELGWWSATRGRAFHHTLAQVPPFRVSRYGLTGMSQIVDGGVVFQSQPGEPVYFVHEDGKVETFSIPPDASVRSAVRVGKRWILFDGWAGNVSISWSDDAGKTWQQRRWGLAGRTQQAGFTLVGDKPTIVLPRDDGHALLFGLDPSVPDDPPAPVVVDTTSADSACDAHASRARDLSSIPFGARWLHARVGRAADHADAELTADSRVMRYTTAGKACTAAYTLAGQDPRSSLRDTAFVFPEASGWTGWWFSRAVDAHGKRTYSAQPLTCQAPGAAH